MTTLEPDPDLKDTFIDTSKTIEITGTVREIIPPAKNSPYSNLHQIIIKTDTGLVNIATKSPTCEKGDDVKISASPTYIRQQGGVLRCF